MFDYFSDNIQQVNTNLDEFRGKKYLYQNRDSS